MLEREPGNWKLTALHAAGAAAVMVGLFYTWFVVQNRYAVFLYFHRGTQPFDAATASRYWMAGLVAAGIVMLLYTLLNGLLGWVVRRQNRIYAPPNPWQVWAAAAPMAALGAAVVVMGLGRPALTLENTAACAAAVLIGLALAVLPGAIAARAPTELLWLFGYGVGLTPILLLLRVVELPQSVWGASGCMTA